MSFFWGGSKGKWACNAQNGIMDFRVAIKITKEDNKRKRDWNWMKENRIKEGKETKQKEEEKRTPFCLLSLLLNKSIY